MGIPAVFWDRDNTLNEDPGYLAEPDKVVLLPGVGAALRRLSEAGFENICCTNQSGIARGVLDEPTLTRIHERLQQLLLDAGARLDAIYYCPYLDSDEAVVTEYRQDSDLRKPKPGMLIKASLERNIDLAASWSIGDSLRDAQAGRAAGCRTILLRTAGDASAADAKNDAVDFVADSIEQAVEIVLKHTRSARPPATMPTSSGPAEIATTLQEILTFLRMADRRSRTEDFTLSRLSGAVIQVVAIGVALWAISGWILNPEDVGPHLVRLLFAIFLQLLALTFLLISAKRH